MKCSIHQTYQLTLKIVDDADLFNNPVYQEALVGAFGFCQKHKSLKLFSWLILPNRIELIATKIGQLAIGDVLEDVRKYTSKLFVKLVSETEDPRKDWLLYRYDFTADYSKHYTVKSWTTGNSKHELPESTVLEQK